MSGSPSVYPHVRNTVLTSAHDSAHKPSREIVDYGVTISDNMIKGLTPRLTANRRPGCLKPSVRALRDRRCTCTVTHPSRWAAVASPVKR